MRRDHPIHLAAAAGNAERLRQLLDADPTLIERGNRAGGTPLHRAVATAARPAVAFLLERGANIHAIHGTGIGSGGGFSPHDVQAIDMAIWGDFGRRPLSTALEFGHENIARYLLDHGADPTWPE